MTEITLTVNGRRVTAAVEPRTHLADFLRESQRLTGTHLGCEQGVCGACTILLDGHSSRACLMFAVQADGSRIDTVEGLSAGSGDAEALSPVQQAFRDHHAVQCGFCTPGMLMTCVDLLGKYTLASDADIRAGLSGNLCRCTGYEHIVRAVRALAARR
jgi:carbon-monoxide dehydrogenase small subunit